MYTLYSKNRIKSISAEYVEESLKASLNTSDDAVLAEEVKKEEPKKLNVKESTIDFKRSEGESNYFDLMESSTDFGNIIETSIVMNSINLEEDAILTESVSNDSSVSANAINRIIIATEGAVNQTGLRFYNVSSSILECDDNVFTKYIKNIKNGKFCIENFAGIDDFLVVSKESGDIITHIADISRVFESMMETITDIQYAESNEEIKEAQNIFKTSINTLREENTECIKAFMMKIDKWVPTNEDVEALTKFADGSAYRNFMSNITENAINELEDISSDIAFTLDEMSNAVKENAIYNVVEEAMEYVQNAFNISYDLSVREFASLRQALITVGRYASVVNESKEAQEINNYTIGESSNAYVFDKFDI